MKKENIDRLPPSADRKTVTAIGMMYFFLAGFLVLANSAFAGNFGVSPLDLQFSPNSKSGVLTVTNDDTKPLSLRLRAMRWTQDAEGRDVYEDATDLIFFPKRFELKPGEQRVVRAGVDQVPAGPERAYRLFIEEVPPADIPREGGSKLAVLLSIGIPVFVSANAAKPEAVILSSKSASRGSLEWTIRNAGNTRLRLSRVVGTDGKGLLDGVASRYIFPGITKSYVAQVERDVCTPVTTIAIETDTLKVVSPQPIQCSR